MQLELLTIDRVPTIFSGLTDPVQRFVSRSLTSDMDIRMLRIDQQIRVGVPMRRSGRTLPVFAECRNDEEFPKIMAAASPHYHGGWAQGILRVRHEMLQSAEFWFPQGSQRRLTDYMHLVYDLISSDVVIPPHHKIMVNGRLRFGFIPGGATLEQYYPSD